jgi:hypothetical protein
MHCDRVITNLCRADTGQDARAANASRAVMHEERARRTAAVSSRRYNPSHPSRRQIVADETRAIVPLEDLVRSEAEDSPELAVRPPEQLAAEVAKVMDLIAEVLHLETPHPSTAHRVRGARTVPREFVISLIGAAERRPDLPVLGDFDSAEARAVLESAEACRLVAERTVMLLASLNYTIEARWSRVVSEAMKTYLLASILAKDLNNVTLAAETENLRRQLGRKGRGKKKGGKKGDEEAE